MRTPYRHTKIIATIGPSTETAERLGQLIAGGVDVLRLNMAPATCEWVNSLNALRERTDAVMLSGETTRGT